MVIIMAMPLRKHLSPVLLLALLLVCSCAPRLAPATPTGVTLEPGRYIAEVYRSPDFNPAAVTYTLEPFTVSLAQGVDPAAFAAILQDELSRGLAANGLKITPASEVRLAGTVQDVDLGGTSVRFLSGKIWVDLVVSGAITRGETTLFAFQDRIHLNSPVNPGPPAPKESDLLLRQAARTLVIHLLNELLLYRPLAEGR
jgi:hypothetical protein